MTLKHVNKTEVNFGMGVF